MKKLLPFLVINAVLFFSCADDGIEEIIRPAPTKLETPSDVEVDESKITSSSLLITWTPLEREDVESYTVAYAIAGGAGEYVELTSYSGQCTLTGLEMLKTYRLRIKANSSEGEEYDSDWTEEVDGTTIDILVPAIPVNVTVETTGTTSSHIALKWDEVNNASTYIVAYKSALDNVFSEIEAESNEFTIKGLSPATEYEVKVKSRSQSGNEYDSNFSTTVNGKTLSRSEGIFNGDDMVDFAAEVSAGADNGGSWINAQLIVAVRNDIDMEGIEWTPISSFKGTLDGGGHSISNLNCTTDATHIGLFANLSGIVKNLVIDPSCEFNSTATSGAVNIGAFAGELFPGAELHDCENHATISGGTNIGGLAGASVYKAAPVVLISGCKNYGTIKFPSNKAPHGNILIGGIIGSTEIFNTITDCINYGTCTSEASSGNYYSKVGGIVGNATDTELINCENGASGSVMLPADAFSVAYIGGITGCSFRSSYKTCVNNGRIIIGSSASAGDREVRAGGIMGSSEGNNTEQMSLSDCHNNTPISINTEYDKPSYLGGIVGYITNNKGLAIENCTNSGDLSFRIKTQTSRVGGIVGYMNASTGIEAVGRESTISNCRNTGNITSSSSASPWLHTGGIAGGITNAFTTVTGCINDGNVTISLTSRACGGGIVGETQGPITGCTNNGTVSADNHNDYYCNLGGIVSRVTAAVEISSCINNGNIIYSGIGDKNSEVAGYVGFGGIVGLLQYGSVTSCQNYGTLLDVPISADGQTLRGAKGLICGWASDKSVTTISGCKVGGALGDYNASASDKGVSSATPITSETFAQHIYGRANQAVTVTNCEFGSK